MGMTLYPPMHTETRLHGHSMGKIAILYWDPSRKVDLKSAEVLPLSNKHCQNKQPHTTFMGLPRSQPMDEIHLGGAFVTKRFGSQNTEGGSRGNNKVNEINRGALCKHDVS